MKTRTLGFGFGALLSASVLWVACGMPQEQESTNETVNTQEALVSGHTVANAVHFDVSPPLREMAPADPSASRNYPVRLLPRPAEKRNASGTGTQNSPPATLMPSTSTNWEGVGQGFSGPQGSFSVASAPPDTTGDVGPNHYVQIVNSSFAVFNKTGTVLYGPVATNTLWSGFGGGCQTNNDGDATVNYDPIANRWLITQFSVSTTPYLECIAVSQTADPTGAYYRYSFSYTNFPDYPKAAVWPDAYYITYNMFSGGGNTFAGAEVCAYDRSKMLTGAAATQQCYTTSTSYGGLLAADVDGSRQPAAGTEWVVGLGSAANTLAYWKFHVDWTTPSNSTFTGPTSLTVSSFSEACSGGTCIPQSGTTQQLDSLADRIMNRVAYRNFTDHESLLVSHSVTAGSSSGVRWYELRPSSGSLSVYQQGTYAPDSAYRWMPSIAMDQAGDIAIGFSISSSSMYPGIRYAGRLATDAVGTMPQGEGTIVSGTGAQSGSNLSRWGDYSSMTVDPTDDCTFWYTDEYIASTGAFNWHTRIGSFKYSNCGGTPPANDFSISASPTSASVTQGSNATFTVSTAVTSGSAQTVNLSISGLPSGATGTFNPTSVTAGGSSTLTVATSTSTPSGTYTLTITGTGTSATHSTSVTLTVNTAGGGGGLTNGGFESGLTGWTSTGSTSTSTTAHSGSSSGMAGSTSPTNGDSTLAQTFTVPSGMGNLTVWYRIVCPDSVTYDWASISLKDNTSNNTTTMLPNTCSNTGSWSSVSAAVTAGHSVTLTLLSHDDNYAGDATYVLYDDVTLSSGGVTNPVTNPGFETGSTSGWTSAGTTGVSTTAHGGSYSGMAGSTSQTNGDSSLAQTFTIPSGASTLSLWYRIVCPDTVTYDWATITLKDNTTGTTTTMLGKTCTNTGSWSSASAAVTAGHSVTLTLLSHDDNYAGDATYTLFDDVSVQ